MLYGFVAYFEVQNALGWESVGEGYDWSVGYYLDQMRTAEHAHGERLLGALDVHWYPEAQGDNRIVCNDGDTEADVAERLQAPRTLCTEDSWIADCCSEYLPISPRLQRAIETHDPGTTLAIAKHEYGAKGAILGGLAQVDAPGACRKHGVSVATL